MSRRASYFSRSRKFSSSRRNYRPPIWSENKRMYPMTSGQKINYAVRSANILKGIVNAEKKMFTQTTNQSVTSAGQINLITDIAAGDDVNNRNGNSILAKSLNCRLVAYFPTGTSGVTGAFLRHIIVKDTLQTGTSPLISAFLEGDFLSPINTDAVPRFQVLCDDMICLDTAQSTTQSRQYFRKLDFHIKYFATSSGSQYKNNLYQVLVTNNPSVQVESNTRLSFYDN